MMTTMTEESRGNDVHDGGNDNGGKSSISKGKGKGGNDDHDGGKYGTSKYESGNDGKTTMTKTFIIL
jgi:hypothetical protein